jgi:hypothetical protein
MVWNVVTLLVAVIALGSSTAIAVRQVALMRKANHLPAYIDLLSQLRSPEFNAHFRLIMNSLAQDYDPQLGISGLPDNAQAAVYDVGGLFTEIAALRLLGILDERVDVLVRVSLVNSWRVLAPFVKAERVLLGVPGMYWRSYEEFAADAAALPANAIDVLIEKQRRRNNRRLRVAWFSEFRWMFGVHARRGFGLSITPGENGQGVELESPLVPAPAAES